MYFDGGWKDVSETSWHGDCARVKVSCGESEDEGVKVGPEHWEVADEGLVEALVKLSVNESNKSGRHVLLQSSLFSET